MTVIDGAAAGAAPPPAMTRYPVEVLTAQATFRAAMEALARPGRIHTLTMSGGDQPSPMMPGTAALARAVFDNDTPLWLDAAMACGEAAAWLRFHTGAPIVPQQAIAAFALVADPDTLPPFDSFGLGSSDYPDRSTTLIIQVASLTGGPALTLRGPGIAGAATLTATLPAEWPQRCAANNALFPRGVDLLLVAGNAVVGLPRTTRVTAGEG